MKLAPLAVCAGVFAIFTATYAAAKPGYAITNVNLRSGAGTNNDVVAKIPGGSRIEINNCTNGWCEVTYQGKSGFAIETALDTSGRAPPRRTSGYYSGGPVYSGPPAYYAPGPYYGPPAYYYPGPYYYGYGPYWRRRYWW
jgi:uncharacterized protein YraI